MTPKILLTAGKVNDKLTEELSPFLCNDLNTHTALRTAAPPDNTTADPYFYLSTLAMNLFALTLGYIVSSC